MLYNALLATLNPGDEVVIPAPCWVSYADIVLLGGASRYSPRPSPSTAIASRARLRSRHHAANDGADPQLAVEPRPARPTRTTISRRGPTCCRLPTNQHVWVLTDDMYEHLLYDGLKFFTPAQVEPRLYDRTLTMNGLSKAYCMTGWRLGYAAGPEPLINAMRKLQSQSTSNPTSITQWARCRSLERTAGLHRPQQQGVRRAPRSRCRHVEPGQGHQLPEAGRRVLRLSELRRRHRQDHAQGRHASRPTRISSPRCSRTRALRSCTARHSRARRRSASLMRPRRKR